MKEPTYEDYMADNDSWFLIVPPETEFVWQEEDVEPFDTEDAKFTVWYGGEGKK